MENEIDSQHKELKEVDQLIHKLSSSAFEFRNSIHQIIFTRLYRFFEKRNNEIRNDTELKHLFGSSATESEWEGLKQIGLKIPSLERAKAFGKISVIYCLTTLIALSILAVKNLELLFVLWGLPILGGLILTALSPLLLFMMLFKRRHFPCGNIEELIDMIISINWANLVADDKRLFKKLVREEEEWKKRSSA